jgi:K+:H+ antiporter
MPNLLILLIQIIIILGLARVVGIAFKKMHQPAVMGEMVAGILLGPSLLGWLSPTISASLFPPASLGFLSALSQIGLIIFMFLVGLELDTASLKKQGHRAILISHVSIMMPFFFGVLLSLYLYPRLSDSSVMFIAFALFMGAAMSITAFPVLARILSERKMVRSKVGTVTIACAAVDDVTAWFILAGIIVFVRSTGGEKALWVTILGSLGYIALMVGGVRHLLCGLEDSYRRAGHITQNMIAVILLILFTSALTTEWLGIHALFGSFLAGAIMPKERTFVQDLLNKVNSITVILLLPLLFAFTGLRTSIGLLSGAQMWSYCWVIVIVAVVGKFGGSMIAARISGMSWREAGAVGALMNTRGLMELVILNIGLDIGVISEALFSMMVLMALITTFMTTPVLALIYGERQIRQEVLNVREETVA